MRRIWVAHDNRNRRRSDQLPIPIKPEPMFALQAVGQHRAPEAKMNTVPEKQNGSTDTETSGGLKGVGGYGEREGG